MDEERKKLIDHLKGWRDCTDTKCEDCTFSNPMGTRRVCTVMDSADLIDLALKVVKNDEILLKNQEPVEPIITPWIEDEEGNIVAAKRECGRCGYQFFTERPNFCENCSAPVLWKVGEA